MFNEGSRKLQAHFQTVRLADRLSEVEARSCLTDEDQALVENAAMFFLATADEQGQPLCSYKGGLPGFILVEDNRTIVFPSYDGNGTFRSLGNMLVNSQVALLFIDLETQQRTLVEGVAKLESDHPRLERWEGAQLVVSVEVKRVFSACSRYIHKFKLMSYSEYVPRKGHQPPVPAWKEKEAYRDVLPGKSRKGREL
jgi:predicted pyridoxine 5'-phosphate oxidase superfamily flavin-nucleotide-binding protein